MKITNIDFIHAPELCGHWWIHVHTDEGVTGLGELTRRGETVLDTIRMFQAQVLTRHDPRNVEACWNDMFTYASPYGNSGFVLILRGIVKSKRILWKAALSVPSIWLCGISLASGRDNQFGDFWAGNAEMSCQSILPPSAEARQKKWLNAQSG